MFTRHIAALLSWFLATQAFAGPVVGWGPNGSAQLLNSGQLVAKDGSVYPKYFEKNYLAPGASSIGPVAAPVWHASDAGVTCTTVTSGLPDATVGTALAVTGVSGSTAYCFSNFDLDQADYNKKMKLAFDQAPQSGYAANDQRVDVYSCTVAWSGSPATTCSGAATRLPLSTDSSSVSALPNLTGTYRTTWDSPGSAAAHIQVRVGLNASTTHQNNLAQIVAGPGVVTQGAAVSQWQSYTPTYVGFGTVSTNTAEWRRVGDSIEIHGDVNVGTPTAVTASVSLPSGLTTSQFSNATNMTVGAWNNNQSSGAGAMVVAPGTQSVLNFSTGGGFTSLATGTTVTTSTATSWVAYYAKVPIDQYIGSGTVNVAQNEIQYAASTSGTWDAAAVAGNTIYGPGGAPISGALTAARTKVVQFQYPLQAIPKIQYHVAGTGSPGIWVNQEDSEIPNYETPAAGFGAYISHSGATSTQVTVQFNQYAQAGTTYNSTTGASNWSSSLYDAWRLAAGLPGQALGFGIVQPGVSSGLVSASGVPGNTTGNDAPSGYAGEYTSWGTLQSGTGGHSYAHALGGGGSWASNSVNQLSSDTLNKGVYLLCLNGSIASSSTGNSIDIQVFIGGTNITPNYYYVGGAAGSVQASLVQPITITADGTAVAIKARSTGTAITATVYGSVSYVRIY